MNAHACLQQGINAELFVALSLALVTFTIDELTLAYYTRCLVDSHSVALSISP